MLNDEELKRIDKIRGKYSYAIPRTAVIRRAIALLFEKERV